MPIPLKRTSAISLVALWAMAACAAGGAAGGPGADPGIEGTIRIVGSAPVSTQLTLATATGSYRLTGDLTSELAELSGLQVEVWGAAGEAPDPLAAGSIEVSRYRILDIDGRPVYVGEIVRIDGRGAVLRTDDGREIGLTSIPAAFEVGQRVWVQGPEGIAVQTFGILGS